MSLPAFRDALEVFVRTSVMGRVAVAPRGKLVSSYTDDVSLLRAGEKSFAIRVWQIDNDSEEDANAIHPVAGVEINVVRSLLVNEDEQLYTELEMLENQASLMDKIAWRALSSVNTLIEGPSIPATPEREQQVIAYQVEAKGRLNPI